MVVHDNHPSAIHVVEHIAGNQFTTSQFQRQTREFWVRIIVGIGKMVQQALSSSLRLCRFGQPNNGFHRLHLAEERTDTAKIVVSPMLEQASRLGSDLPLVWMQSPPLVHMLAQFIDEWGGIILLRCGRNSFSFVEHHLQLSSGFFSFLWLWNRRDELSPATAFSNLLGRLSALVEFPVTSRVLVRRIEDRAIEK